MKLKVFTTNKYGNPLFETSYRKCTFTTKCCSFFNNIATFESNLIECGIVSFVDIFRRFEIKHYAVQKPFLDCLILIKKSKRKPSKLCKLFTRVSVAHSRGL